MLLFAIVLFVVAMLVSSILVDQVSGTGDDTLFYSVVVSLMSYALYWGVLAVTGYAHRVVPTIASIMACGSILSLLMVVAFVMLVPFIGVTIASLVAWLIHMWSVPVKGHIIARAIGQHWYVGIAISLTIYIIQRVAFDRMMAVPGS